MKEAAYTYFLEANLAIVFSVLMYVLFLRNERVFHLQRIILVSLLFLSILIPFFQLKLPANSFYPLSDFLQTYSLPEIRITDGLSNAKQPGYTPAASGIRIEFIAEIVYLVGAGIFLLLFLKRLSLLIHLLKNSRVNTRVGRFTLVESDAEAASFSFCRHIVIGKAHLLSHEEKSQIITHELAHLSCYHTADILFIELVKIVFWFNPFVYTAKKLLTSIHEYQADQLTVQQHHPDSYCHVLANSALSSGNGLLASHFNKSLTLKRIAMIKSVKGKTNFWKLILLLPVIALGLAVIACQDQAMKEVMENNKTISQVNEKEIPAELQPEIDKIRQKDPNVKFTYIEGETKEISNLVEKYGDTKKPLAILANPKKGITGILLQDISNYAEGMKNSQGIYSVVEEAASPVGGMGELMKFIQSNLQYPAQARAANVQGKVFIQFVVQEDGSVTDVEVLKGIGGGCDEEAVRVVSATKWSPGKQKGVAVKQRMSIPIQFALGESGDTKARKNS